MKTIGAAIVTRPFLPALILCFVVSLTSCDQPQNKEPVAEKQLTTEEKIQKVRVLIEEVKDEVDYNCCIKSPCDGCAMNHQGCSCANDLNEGENVCLECYAAWQNDEGKVEGVNKDDVKPNYESHGH